MPEQRTIKKSRQPKRPAKAPSTQAGEFVREEIHHIRQGKHGARSAKQAIAVGLSKARRAGVDLPPPKEGKAAEATRKHAERDWKKGRAGGATSAKPSKTRSRATQRALEREGSAAASHEALSKHAHAASSHRTAKERSDSARLASRTKGPNERHEAAEKAVRTKGHQGLVRAARKAARTRARSKG